MKFLKDNSYDIVRLYINQAGITIFSLVLYTSVSIIGDSNLSSQLKIALSVFATLFYFALLYTAAWEFGAKDKIKIDSGRLTPVPAKGTLMSLAANLPNFILALVCVLIALICMFSGAEVQSNTAFFVFNLILRFTNAMFLGIIQVAFSQISDVALSYMLQSIGYFVMPLFAVGVTQIGYTFGEKNIRILSVFSHKPKNR